MTNRAVPRAVRRPAARPGVGHRAAAHGPRRQHPGGHRGGHAAHGRHVSRADRHDAPRPGRRRGAQLRRQRPAAARGAVRRHLDPAGRGRRRRRAGRALFVWHQLLEQAARRLDGRTRQQGSFLGPRFATTRSQQFLDAARRDVPTAFDDEAELLEHVAGCWPTARSSAGSRAAWSSARGRSAPAASSATRARRGCRRR